MNKFLDNSYNLQNKTISTRFFFAPINTGFTENGEPSVNLINFHKLRSGNAIGISYVGNVAISPEFVTNNKTLFFGGNYANWQKLANVIKQNGSLAGIQIACRNSMCPPMKAMTNGDIYSYIDFVSKEISQFTYNDFQKIKDLFVQQSILAYSLGFDVIQIHAAHGYFLSQLLEEKLNIRTDLYGQNRLLLLESIVTEIKQAIPDVILDVRLSVLTNLDTPELELKYKSIIINKITQLDVDIISLSNGLYNVNKQYIYPPAAWGHAPSLDRAIKFACLYPKKTFNVAGNIWDFNLLQNKKPPANLTFSIGRGLIADPKMIIKGFKDGEPPLCRRCGGCNYFSNNEPELTCSVNKMLTLYK